MGSKATAWMFSGLIIGPLGGSGGGGGWVGGVRGP